MDTYTVSIGIPAHNEEANITSLLESILSQKGESFTLEHIYVTLDGTTDATGEKVARMAQNDPRIVLINDGAHLGKTSRLNELYARNESDLILTLDADVRLGSVSEIERLVRRFRADSRIKVLACHLEPVPPARGFIARILYTNYVLWNNTIHGINGGDHIHNLMGSATMLERDFAKSVQYPSNTTCDEGYLYVVAHRAGAFALASDALVWIRPMTSIADLRSGGYRILNERNSLVEYFGPEVLDYYHVPVRAKIMGILRTFVRSPLYTLGAIGYNIWIRFATIDDPLNAEGKWKSIRSTKAAIDIPIQKRRV